MTSFLKITPVLPRPTTTRMWGASKGLTEIMLRSEKVSDVTWDTVDLLIPGKQFTVWSRDDGTPFPSLGEQHDRSRITMTYVLKGT
jgi:hypothetical protein